MKKYPIGFNTRINKEPEDCVPMEVCKGVIEPKKSIVQVYFPHRGMGWAYYNDSFDLKVGDFVYVEGKKSSDYNVPLRCLVDKKGAYINTNTNECARTTVRTLSTKLRLVISPVAQRPEWDLEITKTMGSTPIRVSGKARTAIL